MQKLQQTKERAELEAERGTRKRWECRGLMTNLKGKLMKETSPTEHLPYVCVGWGGDGWGGSMVDAFFTLLVMQVLSPFYTGENRPREGDFTYSSNICIWNIKMIKTHLP